MASAKYDRLNSYPTFTVSNQETELLPKMLAQSLNHALKTRPMLRTGALARKRDSYPTCTVSNQESDNF